VFTDPRGNAHFDGGWQPPRLGEDPTGSLIAMNERNGVRPDANRIGARWRRESDIPEEIYLRACEQLG
jgi:hypothetical protein